MWMHLFSFYGAAAPSFLWWMHAPPDAVVLPQSFFWCGRIRTPLHVLKIFLSKTPPSLQWCDCLSALSQSIFITSQSISLTLNGATVNPHTPEWSANRLPLLGKKKNQKLLSIPYTLVLSFSISWTQPHFLPTYMLHPSIFTCQNQLCNLPFGKNDAMLTGLILHFSKKKKKKKNHNPLVSFLNTALFPINVLLTPPAWTWHLTSPCVSLIP